MPERKNSEARIRANNKYNAKAYDRINIAIPKGKKEIIKAHADAVGQSSCFGVFGSIPPFLEHDMGIVEFLTRVSVSLVDQLVEIY